LAIVLAPTRELAKQVEREFIDSSPLEAICVYGGTPINEQIRKLNYGVDVVIGTPGRVIDLLKRGALSLADIRFVVLDEADQMLSVGFDQDVETILERVPPQRQTLMFSATMPVWIRKLTQKYLKNPVTVDLVSSTLLFSYMQLLLNFTIRVSCIRLGTICGLLFNMYSIC
jgi:superfamily II DNA/RNA helicase